MSQLRDILNDAHAIARDRADGRPVTHVMLKAYSQDLGGDIPQAEVSGWYHWDTQALRGASIGVINWGGQESRYRSSELDVLAGHVPNPFYVNITASRAGTASLRDKDFHMHLGLHHCIQEGRMYARPVPDLATGNVIRFDGLTRLLGYRTTGEGTKRLFTLRRGLPEGGLVDAMGWICDRRLSGSLHLHSSDGAAVHVHEVQAGRYGLITHTFRVIDRMGGQRDIGNPMPAHKLEEMEERVHAYRQTDVSRLPLEITDYSAVDWSRQGSPYGTRASFSGKILRTLGVWSPASENIHERIPLLYGPAHDTERVLQ